MRLQIACLFMVATVSCGGGAELGTCPPDSESVEIAGRAIVNSRCTNCHSTQLSGAARQDAPADYNFNQLELVRRDAADMFDEASSGSMPPEGALPAQAIESMRVWLACGARDVAQ